MNNVAKLNLKKNKKQKKTFLFLNTQSLSIIPPHGPPTCPQRKHQWFFKLTQTALSRCICILQYSSLKTVHQIWSMTSCFIFVWMFFKKQKQTNPHTHTKKTLNKQIEKKQECSVTVWLSMQTCQDIALQQPETSEGCLWSFSTNGNFLMHQSSCVQHLAPGQMAPFSSNSNLKVGV